MDYLDTPLSIAPSVSLRYGPCLSVKQGRELQRIEVPKQPPLQDQTRTYSLVSLSGLEPLKFAGDKDALQSLNSFYNVKDAEKHGLEKVVVKMRKEEEEVRKRSMKRIGRTFRKFPWKSINSPESAPLTRTESLPDNTKRSARSVLPLALSSKSRSVGEFL